MACGTQMCRVTHSQDDQIRAVLPRRGDNPLRRLLAEFHHDYRRLIKFRLFSYLITGLGLVFNLIESGKERSGTCESAPPD
jgi:predicted PurR-regulated permease PerM